MGRIHQVTPEQLNTWLQEDSAVLIDVRESQEYQKSAIESAHHMPLSEVSARNIQELLLLQKKVVLYCRSGKRSMFACEKLQSENLACDLWNLVGGILAWQIAELPIIKPI